VKLSKVMRSLGEIKGKLAERNGLQRWLARKVIPHTQALGFSVLGDHFYEPIPNIRHIRDNYKDEPRQLPGFVADPLWVENMKKIIEP